MIAPDLSPTPDPSAYEQFYGFVRAPFTLTPDPRFLYRSQSHEEAITNLRQALRRKEGFIILTGDIGTGKTTICRALLEQLDANTFTSLVLNPFLSIDELLREVLADFGVLSHHAARSARVADATTHDLISTLHEFLMSLLPIRGSAVLIIDEAQHLSPLVLEQIRVLSNLETNESKLLQIVLVGQLNLLDVLSDTGMRQLNQRVSIRATLHPLNRQETEAYVDHRLQVARGSTSGSGSASFRPAALDLVHRYSGGVPRVINLLCDRSLMEGTRAGQYELTPELVKRAAQSLGVALPARRRGMPLPFVNAPLPRRAAVAVGIAALAALVVLLAPIERLLDAPLPSAKPPAQTLLPTPSAKPIPTENLYLPPPITPPVFQRQYIPRRQRTRIEDEPGNEN